VVLAEDPHAVGEDLLVQGDGPAQVPRQFVGAGEVVAGAQGLGAAPEASPARTRRQADPLPPVRASGPP